MATRDSVRKFAEQALQVDRLLNQRGVDGNAGRVILILNSASRARGTTQKQMVTETALPKDVVSKQVKALVKQELLTQQRDAVNPQFKRLYATDGGKELLSAVKEILRPAHDPKLDPDPDGETLVQTEFDLSELLNGNFES
jgi:DNA-binding MarR family transcriptional regulator